MQSVSSMNLGIVIILIQVLWCGIGESQPCSTGFGSDFFLFKVPGEHLQTGTVIGSIVFNVCSERTHTDFMSTDTRYHVESDGTVKLNTQVTLHNGYNMFSVHAWDSMGKKHTASVRVEHQDRASHQYNQQEDVNKIKSDQNESHSVLFALEFPKSGGLQRRKRDWVIPPISLMENDHKGPYPKQIERIRSNYDKEILMLYNITGEGADQPPVGLFTIARRNGWLSVSGPVDREAKARYVLLAYADSPMNPNVREDPIEVIVQVLDQNDNSPVFTQNPFFGSVREAAKIGVEFMTITATDADDPDTDNAAVRYSIISQTPPEPKPNMFAINPVSGAIRVNADGLDRAKYPEYNLEVQAADGLGEGRATKGKAIITVTDNNDKSSAKVTWVIPPIRVPENALGQYPIKIVQIKSSHAKVTRVKYVISGGGAELPPVGLFIMEKNTGELFAARPLDRETRDKYVLQAHIIGDNMHGVTVDFTIHVVDQNDNTPVFTQAPFIGSVSDASKIGFEFMTISATDADDPNTDNADIRYSIISQSPPEPSPNMFAVNPVTGAVRVNAEGLDSIKYSKYVLKIQATDMQGNGFSTLGDAVILVHDIEEETMTESPGIWEISPICIPENSRGPFPEQLAQIKSRHAKQSKVVYSIPGEGADQGLFTVDKDSGMLSVTKPLDRETKHEYVLQAHGTVNGRNEHLNEITIRVIDQNDNKPVFTQTQFRGSVPKTSKIGFEFMTISASDADDPKTENGNIRYSIISQDPPLPQPNMFEINSFTGEIQVNDEGFDIEKYPEYTLEIQAGDMQGNGFQIREKAVITVTA